MQAVDKPTTRTAAEDDGIDQIGSDTPRSGIATPQPDPHDKRLPGIMSYFGQVRQDPSISLSSSSSLDSRQESTASPPSLLQPPNTSTTTMNPLPPPTPPDADALLADASQQHTSSASPSNTTTKTATTTMTTTETPQQLPAQSQDLSQVDAPSSSSSSLAPSEALASHPPVPVSAKSGPTQHLTTDTHAYPTPPPSQPCSSASSAIHVLGSRAQDPPTTSSSSQVQAPAGRSASLAGNALSAAQQLSFASRGVQSLDESRAAQSSNPNNTTLSNSSNPNTATTQPPSRWFSFGGLKELTRGIIFKSGPSTPTRALSTAHPSQSEGKDSLAPTSNDGAETSGTQTPRSTGAQVPAARGKLTIKISEARGLRKCRDPYVVAVFQRSELISGGPRPSEDEEPLNVAQAAIGGIPIQRSGSDSGRPMAIPMRSRQSSNTSITDYNTFRNNRNGRNASFTNPKWDAEAVL